MTNPFESPSDKEGVQTENQESSFDHPLVGEGKKYATVEAALSALTPAQEHIQKLEAELAEMRGKVKDQDAIEETLKELRESKQEPINPDEISKLVDSRLDERTEAQKAKANVESVVEELTKRFGDKELAKAAYDEKAKELGISDAVLTELAARSPKAVLSYFKSGTGNDIPAKTTGSVNTDALNTGSVSGERDFQYWQQIRRQNEKHYYDPATQRQMRQDIERLGRDKFFNKNT